MSRCPAAEPVSGPRRPSRPPRRAARTGRVGSIELQDVQFAWDGPFTGDAVYRPGDDAVIQATIVNDRTYADGGQAADRLVSVRSPIAAGGRVLGDARIPDGQVLTASYDDEPIASITLPGTRTVEITLVGLASAVRAGMTYPVVFDFARAGEVRLEVPVENPDQPRISDIEPDPRILETGPGHHRGAPMNPVSRVNCRSPVNPSAASTHGTGASRRAALIAAAVVALLGSASCATPPASPSAAPAPQPVPASIPPGSPAPTAADVVTRLAPSVVTVNNGRSVGSPLGFEGTVTSGIVSALHRRIPGSAAESRALVDLIQVDAAISPGNSGGALLDAHGRVIGINEAYIPPAAGAVSLGFAIPAATAVNIADQLLADGSATHPYLGVTLGRLTPELSRGLGVAAQAGALVQHVQPDGPAGAASVRPSDVIVGLGEREVGSVEDLLGALRDTEPDQRTRLTVLRQGQRIDLTITIGSEPI